MNNATIANLGAIYLALLEHPHDAWRTTHQWVLCDLRDIIAEASGSSAEAIQTSFEERALINRNPNARGRHDYRGTSRAGEETCSTAGATMPPNPVQCSTRDGSGDAWPDPVEHNLDLSFAHAVRPRRPGGYDLGVFAVDESAKELQLDDLRKYGSTFTRVTSSGERERIPPEDVYLGTQPEIGHLDQNETMDDLRRRLRSTMAVPVGMLGRQKPVNLIVDPRIHAYVVDWQERIRKLFERSQYLYECPPGMSALEHVMARAPWRDIAPVIWANLQRYGHAPIPFNPATWTGARQ